MYMQWETCFENEAKGNSKMAFYVSLNISYSLSNPFGSIGQLFFMNFCLNMATDPGGTAIHVLYVCRCEGYDFQAVYSSIGCINQSVWVQNRVSFFTKLTSWLKILSRILSAVRNQDSDDNPWYYWLNIIYCLAYVHAWHCSPCNQRPRPATQP